MSEKTNDHGALLQKIKSAIPGNKSYLFSLVSLHTLDRCMDNIVAGGAVSDFDTIGKLDMPAGELFEPEIDARSVDVESHVFLIGSGESEDMPERLVTLLEEYGAEDFIKLAEVDQIARHDFTLDAEDFGL